MLGKQTQEEGKRKKSYVSKDEKLSPCFFTPESLAMPLFIKCEDHVYNIYACGG